MLDILAQKKYVFDCIFRSDKLDVCYVLYKTGDDTYWFSSVKATAPVSYFGWKIKDYITGVTYENEALIIHSRDGLSVFILPKERYDMEIVANV
jgi:hypothetical protein